MTTKEHLKKHDTEIAAIRKLIHTGMKMMVQIQEEQKATAKNITRLEKSQERTDKSLQALIDQLRGGTNGHANGTL